MSALVPHSPSSAAMWRAYLDATGLTDDTPCSLVVFGSDAATQDELAALVARGPKRATTAQLRWYGGGGERYPLAGDLFIAIDSQRRAWCVCRMTRVEERRFGDVDETYAWIEGEGDRTLASWREVHLRFFQEEAAAGGFAFDDDSHVVLQYFDLVWPVADANGARDLRP